MRDEPLSFLRFQNFLSRNGLLRAFLFSFLAASLFLVAGCGNSGEKTENAKAAKSQNTAAGEVVVYAALDQIFSEPILKQFEERTGIRVRAVYDTEAAKTVGLMNRLLAEAPRPRCDVFWNNEIVRTLLLKSRGVTAPYQSPEAAAFPASMRDPEGHWTGFAARARVVIYNKNLIKEADVPRRMEDLADPKWRGRCAIANPLFGTTSTHAAVLWAMWGPEITKDLFEKLRANSVQVLASNATVRDRVAWGEIPWGLTDTDDAQGALMDKHPVGVAPMLLSEVAPAAAADRASQSAESAAASSGRLLLLPNTVCLIRNGPNPEAGRRLIDFLLSAEVEQTLAGGRSAQFPLRPGLKPPAGWETVASTPALEVDWEKVREALGPSAQWLDANFVK